MSNPAVEVALRDGLAALGLDLDAQVRGRLSQYLALLHQWNGAFNLTAVRDPLAMVHRHVLESLALAPLIEAPQILDVGSGAGLPGLPLALAFGDRQFTLLDANGKKARFLRQVRRELRLGNVEIAEQRVEDFAHPPFGQITARAFAAPAKLLPLVEHLLADTGQVLAMVAQPDADEVPGFELERVVPLPAPGVDAPRHVLVYRRWPESSQ